MLNSIAYCTAYVFCDFKELPLFAMTTAPIFIKTIIIGSSSLSAMISDSENLYFKYEIYSIIYHNKLLA